MFALVNFFIGIALAVLAGSAKNSTASFFFLLLLLFGLITLLPGLAVSVRRLHATGRSGWWLLIVVLVPLVGLFVLLALMLLPSEPGENVYGPSPFELRKQAQSQPANRRQNRNQRRQNSGTGKWKKRKRKSRG